jgi:hypothetical protein
MVILVIFHGFLYVFQRVSQLWWFQINPTWATWDAEDGTPSTSRKITRSGKRSSVTMASQEGFTGGVFSQPEELLEHHSGCPNLNILQ